MSHCRSAPSIRYTSAQSTDTCSKMSIREGNGRTQMAFFAMLADQAGFSLKLEKLEPEPFLGAMIESFQGRMDALTAQLRALM